MLNYQIIPISTIEASTSPEPDDVSRVSIRIEARASVPAVPNAPAGAAAPKVDIARINFIVRSAARDSVKSARQAALTLNPKSVTPVAEDFRNWRIAFEAERASSVAGVTESIFKASPESNPARASFTDGQTVTFILRDIEVIDQDGNTDLLIEEFTPDQTVPARTTLTLRKIYPNLRIDRFTASPSVVQAGEPVELSWATTGATEVRLDGLAGLAGLEITAFQALKPTDPTLHDSKLLVRPGSTQAFTLRAAAGSFAEVSQQLTVTVTDQVKANKLVVGSGTAANAGDLSVQGTTKTDRLNVGAAAAAAAPGNAAVQNLLTAGKLQVGSAATTDTIDLAVEKTIKAKNITVDESISAEVVSGRGTVPVGGIIMFGGSLDELPKDWCLCDGKTRILSDNSEQTPPNLSGRFIVGIGSDGQGNTYTANQQPGGFARVFLTEKQLPRHKHNVTVEGGGAVDNVVISTSGDGEVTAAPLGTGHQFIRRTVSPTAKVTKEDNIGSNEGHENRPPFFALAYIMRLRLPAISVVEPPAPEPDEGGLE